MRIAPAPEAAPTVCPASTRRNFSRWGDSPGGAACEAVRSGLQDGLLRDLGLELSSLAEAEALDRNNGFDHLGEPVTMVRRHAIEAFQSMTMLEPALVEKG